MDKQERENYQKVLLRLLGTRPIAFNPDLARAIGSAKAGLFMSQLLYWTGKGRNPEWIYKTSREFEEETSLTKKEQLSAQKLCVEKKLIEVKVKGVPPMRHFKINKKNIEKLLLDFYK